MDRTVDAAVRWSQLRVGDGVRDVRVADAGQCAWWTVKGYVHSAQVSTGWRRSSVTALAFLLSTGRKRIHKARLIDRYVTAVLAH